MNCSTCGETATGNFCPNCGAKQSTTIITIDQLQSYQKIIADDRSKRIIKTEAAKAKKGGMSGDIFLDVAELIIPGRITLSLKAFGYISSFLNKKLGFKKKGYAYEQSKYPFGHVLLASIATLAKYSVRITEVSENENGCIILGTVPASLMNKEGDIKILNLFDEEADAVFTGIELKIHGQALDWGSTKKTTMAIMEDIKRLCGEFEFKGIRN